MDLQRREDSLEKKKEKKKKNDRSYSREKKKKKERDRNQSRDNKKKDKKHHRERSKSNSYRDKERSKERDRKDGDKQRKQRSRDIGKPRQNKYYKDHHRSRSKSKKRKNDRDHRRKEDKYEKWKHEKEQNFRFDSPPKSDESNISDDPEQMDQLNKMKAQKQLVSSKADRKLYLGNLPPNITSNQLLSMLNAALKKMELVLQNGQDKDGDSIVSAWVSPDGVGHYAFVEFRSAQEATAGLALNGASLYGYQLKLGRPKQYIEYQKQLLNEFGSDSNIDTILKKFQAIGGFLELPQIEDRIVSPPSKVLVLKHIVTIEELAIDEEYGEILEDVTQMAKRFGDVLQIVIPRPLVIDLEEVKRRVKGLGYVFIKYKSKDYSRYARKQFIKQMFSDRSVAASYFPQNKFDEGDLDVIEKVVIDF